MVVLVPLKYRKPFQLYYYKLIFPVFHGCHCKRFLKKINLMKGLFNSLYVFFIHFQEVFKAKKSAVPHLVILYDFTVFLFSFFAKLLLFSAFMKEGRQSFRGMIGQ